MISAWLAKVWAKLAGWLVLAAGVAVALLIAFVKGKHDGKEQGLADAAEQAVKDAQAAQQVTTDAAQAADKVRQDAAKQPPPNETKRDDLDTDF